MKRTPMTIATNAHFHRPGNSPWLRAVTVTAALKAISRSPPLLHKSCTGYMVSNMGKDTSGYWILLSHPHHGSW